MTTTDVKFSYTFQSKLSGIVVTAYSYDEALSYLYHIVGENFVKDFVFVSKSISGKEIKNS